MDLSRYRGCLFGLAAGDALGTSLEFQSPGSFTPIEDMIGGGVFHLRPGQWTDDTSMALCLAESLVECQGFDLHDQMSRYQRWYRQGYMSSTGRCFDIGGTTRQAIQHFERTGNPVSEAVDPFTAGNGSLMRLAPAPLAFARSPALAIEKSGQSSTTTHPLAVTVDACRYFGALLVGAVNGISKEVLLSPRYSPIAGYWQTHPLCPEIDEIAAGSFKSRNPPQIRGVGYVVQSLEAALWAFERSSSFREGCLLAVNLGDDADTTGAVYGQLAGAFYAEAGIPDTWRMQLAMGETIGRLAEGLFQLALR